ncbi:MAG: DUF4345 domain-containing protein [Acidobacteriota bacterium]
MTCAPKTRRTVAFLLVSGLLLLFIGSSLLLAPHSFHAGNGIVLGDDPSLLSEVRAPGGLLAASGLLLLWSSFRASLRPQALQLAVLVYGSFGLARVVAVAVDGLPAPGLVGAAAMELAVAALGLLLLAARRPAASSLAHNAASSASRS